MLMDVDGFKAVMTVHAEADPVVTMRVLGFIAVTNDVPSCFSARGMPDGNLKLVIELAGCTEKRVDFLSRRIETIPTVLSVDVARQWAREQVMV